MGKPNKRLSGLVGDPSNKKRSGSDDTATAESNKMLSTISGIDQLLSGIGSFNDKAALVVEKMAQAAYADSVAFLVPDERLSGLRMVASSGRATQLPPLRQLFPYDLGITGRAFTSGKSIVTNSYPKHADALEHHIAAGVKSTLALPIMFDGIVIGIFIFGSRKSGHFTDQRVGILETVGNQLGPLLENAKLHQELAAIDEISRTITTTLDIDQVYEQFAAELKKLVELDRIAIDIIEPDGKEFIVKYIYGEELAGRQKGDVGPVQGNQLQIVVETKETLLRGNIADSPDWPMNRAALKAGLPSLTLVPLITKGRVIGCLGLRSRNINPHGSREIVILQRLASQIAPAIENTRLFEASQRAESENALLAEIGRVISSSLDINEVYEHFADTVSSLIEFDRIGISLLNQDKNSLNHAYFAGTVVPERQPGEVSRVPGTQFEEVLGTGVPSLLDYENECDVAREFPALLPAFAAGLRSFLMVPLFSKDEVMGVLVLRSKQFRAFSKRDVDLAMKIGYQISPFVECSRLYEDLRKSADELAIGDQIATIITSAADIGELYEKFAGEMRRLVGFDRLACRRSAIMGHF